MNAVFVLIHEDYVEDTRVFSTYSAAFQYVYNNFPDERWGDDRTKLPIYWHILELEIDIVE